MNYKTPVFILLFLLCMGGSAIFCQPLKSSEIDILVERTMSTFDVPGIAVAVIKDGKVIHSKGYGVRSLHSKNQVDENTLFGIASNSKAFTAAALGMLLDEGRLDWNDRVIDFIPEFRVYHPYVTEEFTIKDLLTHRSGLGLGAGDLMFWPDSNDFTLKDIIYNLRFLKPVSGFRTKYDYDNLLYIVAGEIIARASGISWEEFVETRIMKPLGMNHSAASFNRIKDFSNVIDPHVPINGKVQVVGRDRLEVANAAAGIYSNVSDLSKWVIMHLNRGKYGEEMKQQLFNIPISNEMWTPQTIIPVRGTNSYQTHFKAYGLGWVLTDINGFLETSHTGGLTGMVTQVSLIPELQLGIIVLTNQQAGGAFRAITNQIKDSYLGVIGIDRVKENSEMFHSSVSSAEVIVSDVWKTIEEQKKNRPTIDLQAYTGIYHDRWFGNVTIRLENGKLHFYSVRSPRLAGEMHFYKGNTFVVRWYDRSFDADAFVLFGLNYEGKPNTIKMKAVSPMTDFSYDFHDLDFIRLREE